MIEFKNEVPLLKGERIDDLERNGYGIIQKENGFCFGMDAVLLSGFARVPKGGLMADLGTGTGIIPILLRAKTGAKKLYGLEIQPEMADMARRSCELNGISGEVEIITGDIREYKEVFAGLLQRFDTVTSNPPYMKIGSGILNPLDTKTVSRHELLCSLRDVCSAASALLKSGGHFYMVHRPLRLSEIFAELREAKLEPKRIKFVHPYTDREANMVLIDAAKGGRPECRVEKPLIIFDKEGSYTKEITEIYGY